MLNHVFMSTKILPKIYLPGNFELLTTTLCDNHAEKKTHQRIYNIYFYEIFYS